MGRRTQISESGLENLRACPEPALLSMVREEAVGLGLLLLFGLTL